MREPTRAPAETGDHVHLCASIWLEHPGGIKPGLLAGDQTVTEIEHVQHPEADGRALTFDAQK